MKVIILLFFLSLLYISLEKDLKHTKKEIKHLKNKLKSKKDALKTKNKSKSNQFLLGPLINSACNQKKSINHNIQAWRKALGSTIKISNAGGALIIPSATGNNILCPANDASTIVDGLKLSGAWEPHLIDIYQLLVKPGNTVAEVGACFGEHTVLLAQLVGNAGKVYSFEPNNDNFKSYLINNIASAGVGGQVTLRNVAAGDHNGSFELINQRNGYGWGQLYKEGESKKASYILSGHTFTKIALVKLDTELAGKTVDFLKIDVEGIQCDVLKGGMNLLKSSPNPIVMVEWLTKSVNVNISLADKTKCIDMLFKGGMKHYYLLKQINPFSAYSEATITNNINNIDQNFCNPSYFLEPTNLDYLKNYLGLLEFIMSKKPLF